MLRSGLLAVYIVCACVRACVRRGEGNKTDKVLAKLYGTVAPKTRPEYSDRCSDLFKGDVGNQIQSPLLEKTKQNKTK